LHTYYATLTSSKAVPRRRRRRRHRRAFEEWVDEHGTPSCANLGVYPCFRLGLKTRMQFLHDHTYDARAAYYPENYRTASVQWVCEEGGFDVVSRYRLAC
jgi:hypothetical protein